MIRHLAAPIAVLALLFGGLWIADRLLPSTPPFGPPVIAPAPARIAEPAASRPVVIDGDTIRIGAERIRILNIDAPELSGARCAAERALAERATARLKQLLAAGAVAIERDGTDRYGRTLARVTLEGGRDAGTALLAEGLALPWRPGAAAWEERHRTWCPPR